MKILTIQVTSSRAQQHAGGRIINNGRCPLPRHSGYRGRSCHPENQGYASWPCLVQRIAILGTSSIRGAFEEGAKRLLASPPWLNCRPVILSLTFLLFGPAALYAQDTWIGPTTDASWFTGGNWTAGIPTNVVNAVVDNGTTAEIGPSTVATAANVTVGSTVANSTVWFLPPGIGQTAGTLSTNSITIGTGGTLRGGGHLFTNSILDNGEILYDATFSGSSFVPATGSGRLVVAGAGGILILNAANSYTGGTTISAGTLALAGAGRLAATGTVVDNGTFDISQGGNQAIGDLSGSGTVNLGARQLTAGTANSTTFTGTINDGGIGGGTGGSLLKQGTGTLTLTGANTYTGGTTISAGTLQLGNGGTSGSIAGNVVNNGALIFDRSNTVTFSGVTITNNGAVNPSGSPIGNTQFLDSSNAASATITNGGSAFGLSPSLSAGGFTEFRTTSNAANATITNDGGTASGGSGGFTEFLDSSNAASATITNGGSAFRFSASLSAGGFTEFRTTSNAANATITNDGGTASGGSGGFTEFRTTSNAANATITNDGGTASGASGGFTNFLDSSNAANATIITNGGTGGGLGGRTQFFDSSDGGTARAITNGNGSFDISSLTTAKMGIGSIEGSGNYFLGGKTLSVGGNDLSTTVSGVIQDGGASGGTGGALMKVGTGTLTLMGTNTYTGGTFINTGTLALAGGGSLAASGAGWTTASSTSLKAVTRPSATRAARAPSTWAPVS